jgi:hypothetical protein
MSAMFETKLLIECGRQSELGIGAKPRPPITPKLLQPVTDILVNDPTGEEGTVSHTQSETSIRINPVTGTICSSYNDTFHSFYDSSGGSGFSRSNDGGTSFIDGGVHPAGSGGFSYGDPSLVWRKADGLFYYAALCDSGLCLWQSTDDCESFTQVGIIHSGFGDDKELMEVDNNPSSSYFGRFYVAWTDFAAGEMIFTYIFNGLMTEMYRMVIMTLISGSRRRR